MLSIAGIWGSDFSLAGRLLNDVSPLATTTLPHMRGCEQFLREFLSKHLQAELFKSLSPLAQESLSEAAGGKAVYSRSPKQPQATRELWVFQDSLRALLLLWKDVGQANLGQILLA